jgi:hypothetical protein
LVVDNGGTVSTANTNIWATSTPNFYDSLTITNAGQANATTTSAQPLTIGTFTNSGTFLSGANLNISNTFTNSGTFTHNNGTTTLLGATHTLSGTVTFYNLTKQTTTQATTTFAAGGTVTVLNNFIFTGTTSIPHLLRSSSPGSYWNIDPQGSRTISNVDVKDSDNVNATAISCFSSCIDSAHNVNWTFSVLTQQDYRWYANADGVQPGTALAAENSTTTITSLSTIVRLRENITASVGPLATSSQSFKLQYGYNTMGPWNDVGLAGSSAFSNSYGYCRKMTMTAGPTGVATTTTFGFALMASSTIPDLRATSSAGKVEKLTSDNKYPIDAMFTSGTDCHTDTGSVLNYYFENYSSTTGAFTAWVKSTDISSTTAKTVLMYYGNTAATDQRNKAGVWSSQGEAGVWNMDEDPSGTAPQMKDATANANNGTSNGSMTTSDLVAGQVGGAVDFDGSNDYVTNSSFSWPSSSSITVSFWNNTPGGVADSAFSVGNDITDRIQSHAPWSDNILYWDYGTIANGRISTNYASYLNKWTHVTLVNNGTNFKAIYLNGVLVASGTTVATPPTAKTGVWIGQFAGNYHIGKIDDFRIYTQALSAADILTQYNNTHNSAAFWTIGAEETGANPWRFKNNPTPLTGTTITTPLLASSTIKESYEETSPTTANVTAIPVGQTGEYDFALDPANTASSTYYFRMVKADGALLDGYSNYAAITVNPIAASFSSVADQQFSVGQATTSISAITVTDAATPVITTTNDIRIKIATSSVNMKWDTTDTTATLAGTASAKVSPTVSYESNGTVLVVNVTSNFTGNDTLIISDLSFAQFVTANTATSALSMYANGTSVGVADGVDNRSIAISGGLILADHVSGQVVDGFTSATESDLELFALNLTPFGENATINSMAFDLRGISGVLSADLTNAALYRDMNSNKIHDGSDVAVGGAGAVSINEQSGTVTFSSTFSATTSQNYVLVGDVANLKGADKLIVALDSTALASVGATTALTITSSGSVTIVQHIKGDFGGGGSGGAIGGAPPPGNGVTTGGALGVGGSGINSNGSTTIGNEIDFIAPTSNGVPITEWTTPANAYASDGVYATAATNGFRQGYGTFGFNVPTNNTITGITVKLEASGSTAAGTISVRLSWNGGTSSTTLQTTATLTTTDGVYTLGGPSDTWGHVWTASEFDNGNFTIELIGDTSANTISVDAIQVRVYHQASGGGHGGGGAVYKQPTQYFANVYSAVGELFTPWTLLRVGNVFNTFVQSLINWWQ